MRAVWPGERGKASRNLKLSLLLSLLSLLLLLLEELGDGKLLGVCLCLDLLACAIGGVAAGACVPWAVLVALPAAGQLLVALWPDAA